MLDDMSLVDDVDPIGIADRRESTRNQDDPSIWKQGSYSFFQRSNNWRESDRIPSRADLGLERLGILVAAEGDKDSSSDTDDGGAEGKTRTAAADQADRFANRTRKALTSVQTATHLSQSTPWLRSVS